MRGPSIDVAARYYKHPPGGAGWWPDGAPLDSGTAMIAHNNASVVSYQGCREIGHTLAPGGITSIITDWDSVTDADPDLTSGTYGLIPWHQDFSAVVIGPYEPSFMLTRTSPPGLTPRKVRVVVEVTKHAPFPVDSTLTLMAALVSGAGTPLSAPVIARDSTVLTGGAHVGNRAVSLTLDSSRALSPTQTWRSRPGGTLLSASTPVIPLWVWLGWITTDVTLLDAVWSVSAFEIPE